MHVLCEKHPCDRRRGISTLVLPGHRLVCADANETALVAIMGRLVLAEWLGSPCSGGEIVVGEPGHPPVPAPPDESQEAMW